MRTETEWNQAVIQITMKIQAEYPELCKYIEEMPMSSTGDAENVHAVGNSREYYNSLKEMLETYSKTHDKLQERSSGISSKETDNS